MAITGLAVTMCNSGASRTESNNAQAQLSGDADVAGIAKDAFIYGLPLILMDITRRQSVSANSAAAFRAPANQFVHLSKFPDATFRDVVRSNADTYYSASWLDLQNEPVVLTVPDTKGRYYMMPMLDAYTNVFASPGKRTTGTAAGNFLVSGPDWSGVVPDGMQQIKAPTNTVWLIGRTQVNSEKDGEVTVIPLQKQYKLTPLSSWGKTYIAPALINDPDVPKGSPNEVVENMPAEEFLII